MLLVAARKRGWQIEGNDLSGKAIKFAKKEFNLNLYRKFFTNLKLRESYYNAITMQDSLEHTHNPHKILKIAYRSLKPGGIVLITIPIKTIRQLYKKYEMLHLFEFQKQGIRKLLLNNGFEKLIEKEYLNHRVNRLTLIYRKPS